MRCFVTMEIYNEKKNIREVISKIPPGYEVIVVNDGSSDNSGDIARELNVTVVDHPINLGQGIAFVTGIKCAIMAGADIIIHIDGDGQHDPKQIPDFEKYLRLHPEIDVVVGSRRLGSNDGASLIRKYFLPVFNSIVSWITNYKITDYLCGFRAYRAKSLKRVMHIFDDYYNAQYNATEMFIGFSFEKITIAEIPVNIRPRLSGKSYKGNIKYGLNILIAISLCLRKWRRKTL